MAKSIIHIATDEKFVNAAWLQFESVFPKQNFFYIAIKNLDEPLKHVTDPILEKIQFKDLKQLGEHFSNELVVLHSLPEFFFDFVLLLPSRTKIIWLCYGYEVYNDPNYFSFKNLFGKHTYSKISNIKTPKPLNKRWKLLHHFLPQKKLHRNITSYLKKRKAFKRIDILGTSFKEEFKAITRLTKSHFDFLKYWHYPLEYIIDIDAPVKANCRCLVIGNSAAASNNHLEAFNILKTKNLTNIDKIVIPLNYGDNGLKDLIDYEAKLQFGERYYPIHEFLTLNEYNDILSECGIAIFHNKRQQAIGNTLALLWHGARVYLSKHNPFYHFLKRIGITVFSVENDLLKAKELYCLPLETIYKNRSLLYDELHKDKLKEDLKTFVNTM